MSGGHFNYDQHRITDMAYSIRVLIDTNECTEKDMFGQVIGPHYSKEVMDKFREAHKALQKAAAMTHRIDWLVCGDDGPDAFLRRWDEEVGK